MSSPPTIDVKRVVPGVGNIAYVSGVISNSDNPNFEGRGAIFSVQDNGEGANDPADRISLGSAGLPGGLPLNWCMTASPAPTHVVDGNIQVRP